MKTHRFVKLFCFLKNRRNILFFIGGFMFDVFTIERIDAWIDLAVQVVYLLMLGGLLVYQHWEHVRLWTPPLWLDKVWRYNVEALHFFYGGLLSAYVVLYFKSLSGTRAIFFFIFLAVLFIVNETPQIRRYGHRLHLGLVTFCLASFLIYFVPILVGRMNGFVFLLSLLLSGIIVWEISGLLVRKQEDAIRVRRLVFTPGALVLVLLGVFYLFKLIPPVPLSVQFSGIYHEVKKVDEKYFLRTLKAPWYAFWRDESRPFRARPGDDIYFFVRIFAPRRFEHDVRIVWERYDSTKGEYTTTDQMRMTVRGGRQFGFRGYAVKSNYQTGFWRIRTKTGDERILNVLKFEVIPDNDTNERQWKEIRM